MTPSRLALAQQAYTNALQAARSRSTARTWARLLRAAVNLREAVRAEQPEHGAHRRDR